jgi:hypothetical protein
VYTRGGREECDVDIDHGYGSRSYSIDQDQDHLQIVQHIVISWSSPVSI